MDFQRTINFRQNAKFVIRHVFENEGMLKIPHDGLPKDHMWKSRITEFLEFHHFTDIKKKRFTVIFDYVCRFAMEDFVPISLNIPT